MLLQAPTGSGKTTRVPPALLEADWRGDKRIVILEPRRLAARAAARFMARGLGEQPGETVGYRTRLDTQVSNNTRIEVVTEGVLTRMIQSDPGLDGTACVVFDEFHERSLAADLGLALAREVQQALRPDLRILIMSATLDTSRLSGLLGGAPVVESAGRQFPVAVEYRSQREKRLPDTSMAAAILGALEREAGSILAFLPGAGEIRRTATRLEGRLPAGTELCPLYGALPPEVQDAAIAPAPAGCRKVVLATNVAESSLTIEGIRVVVDSGLERRAVFDPGSGMTRLETFPISRASADQRAGRAGRTEPGVCIRLWSESEHNSRAAATPPEILEADLAPLALDLARWGTREPGELAWLDPPPEAHFQRAVALLEWLDALDADGALTAHGREMAEIGLHPRLAHMVLAGRRRGRGRLAAEIAAILGERDLFGPGAGSDLEDRVRALRGDFRPAGLSAGRLEASRKLADSLHRRREAGDPDRDALGRLLARAFPDRIARRRPGSSPRYLLSNGRGAWLPEEDPLAREEWLVAAELDGKAREARIFLAAATTAEAVEDELAGHIFTDEEQTFDEEIGTVVSRRRRMLGRLALDEKVQPARDPEAVQRGLLDAVRRQGLDRLPWTDAARQWQARVMLLHSLWPDQWPAAEDAALLSSLEAWLGPFLAGVRTWQRVQKLDLARVLEAFVGHDRLAELDRLAPTHLEVPAGARVRLDYRSGGGAESGPVLAVKLQAVFGWRETPRIAGGRVPVVLHLLSPAGRTLAVTADLESFWQNAYPEVRKDMRGRYPKHPWPEEPLTAPAQMGTKKRS